MIVERRSVDGVLLRERKNAEEVLGRPHERPEIEAAEAVEKSSVVKVLGTDRGGKAIGSSSPRGTRPLCRTSGAGVRVPPLALGNPRIGC